MTDWLGAALRELAESDADAQAPARLEQTLRQAFRAHAAAADTGAKRSRGWRRTAAGWLAAAAAALALWSAIPGRATRDSAGKGLDADSDAFLSLVEGEPLAGLDAVQVVRVRVTRAALADFGGPADADAPGSLDAEVILGQDGVARAIRIVE